MSRRIKSLELMKKLQPFTQLGLLPAAKAQYIVTEYAKNNLSPLEEFIISPDIPVAYIQLLQDIKQFN